MGPGASADVGGARVGTIVIGGKLSPWVTRCRIPGLAVCPDLIVICDAICYICIEVVWHSELYSKGLFEVGMKALLEG